MIKNLRFWFSMVVLSIVVLFTIQNVATVEVSFLIWTLELPRAILLFVIFVAGAVFGWIFGRIRTTP